MKAMLSATLKSPTDSRYPILCSPKLDGIRCMIVGRVPLTRNLKHIPNKAIFAELRKLNLPPLDGELIVGSPTADDCYRRTNSGVMSQDGEPDWTFWVFDVLADKPFQQRLADVGKYTKGLKHKRIKTVPHYAMKTPEAVEAYELDCLNAGYEGIMGRDPMGLYKQGRSTLREGALWKLKRFEDGEAKIIGFDERMHNANAKTLMSGGKAKRSSHAAGKVPMGTLGALKVKDGQTGTTFDIGTGFTDAERQEIWDNREGWMGRVVKYKSLPIGVKEKPRHPVYLGERKDL